MLKKLIALLIAVSTTQALAVSVSLLKGNGFRDDLGYRHDKTTLTIENFSIWEYGTVFFYYDITEPTTKEADQNFSNQFFGGISPTFSLSKMTGKDWSWKFVRDVSIRLELENGSGNGDFNFQTYFYGFQFDLAVPGFDFVSFNTVLRDDPSVPGMGVQLGTFWQTSWDFGRWNRYKFTGFIATSPWDGNQNSKKNPFFAKKGRFLSSSPQFLYDLGYGLFGKQDRLEVGFEWAYYVNRFQQKNKDESVIQYMTKVSF